MGASELTALEREVIATILRPNHPVFDALRAQFATCRVKDRELTGVGFFTRLLVSLEAARAPVTGPRLTFGGVAADLEGVRHGAGFVLFVEDGRLDFLEGFTYDEPWPQTVGHFAVSALTPQAGAGQSDLDQADRALDPSASVRSPGDIGER